ncbi:ATP-grasp ribosomal peptide maturase [Streptomyces sp. NPDC057638]|uniref:ATP-grasp ribosomal peptide maturase n=1 Tax=Streptomyces sp. NPDC057638 TaxID=3346190 RepID=UPI0036C584CF
MTVLVLTRPRLDATADMVIHELAERGVPVVRLDPADFPENSTLATRIGPGQDAWHGLWRGQHRDLRLEDVTAVYYRRPGGFKLHPGLSPEDAQWAAAEARAGLGGVLMALPRSWINHPHRNALADCAPVALATAARCGLTVPETLITNDPQEARDFVASLPGRRAAYKAVGNCGPTAHDGQQYALWTAPVTVDQITDQVAHTAHLIQQWVDKAYEVRLTAVGNRMFAAEIHAGSEASRIDFRRDYSSLTYVVREVPDPIRRGVLAVMRAFGLRYVAMDFLVSRGGGWYAVDVNPNGQFGFVPELRDPITKALADALQGVAA